MHVRVTWSRHEKCRRCKVRSLKSTYVHTKHHPTHPLSATPVINPFDDLEKTREREV